MAQSAVSRWVSMENATPTSVGISLRIGDVIVKVKLGYDQQTLIDIVQLDFELSLFDPCLFVFCNRLRDKVKILVVRERFLAPLLPLKRILKKIKYCRPSAKAEKGRNHKILFKQFDFKIHQS